MSLTIQYMILGVIFLLIAIWLWRKLSCIRKRKSSECCGCALSETCGKNKKQQE